MGGRTQAGSGSSWRAPQDVVAPEHLESLKYTDSQSFRIVMAEWATLRRQANQSGREPRMVVDFTRQKVRLVITEEPLR